MAFMAADKNTSSKHEEPLRFLVIEGSARTGSMNALLAQLAAEEITRRGAIANLKSISEFDCPSYNQDLEDNSGIPEGAARLKGEILNSDGFIIASPEYTGTATNDSRSECWTNG